MSYYHLFKFITFTVQYIDNNLLLSALLNLFFVRSIIICSNLSYTSFYLNTLETEETLQFRSSVRG